MRRLLLIIIFWFLFLELTIGQNIGIGTDNPWRAKLEIRGAVSSTSAIFGGEGAGISLQRNWPAIGFNSYYNAGNYHLSDGYAATQEFDPVSGIMSIDMYNFGAPDVYSGGSNRVFTIRRNGQAAINTSLTDATLSIGRSTLEGATAYFLGTSFHSAFNYGANQDTYIRPGNPGGRVYINDVPGTKTVIGGFLGINSSDPAYPLEVRQSQGDKGFILVHGTNFHNWEFRVTGSSGMLHLFYDGDNVGAFFPNGDYTSASDRRLKKNVKELTPTLDKLMQLQPVSYEMIHNNPGDEKNIGFIAQDVKTIFPELVRTNTGVANGYKEIPDLHMINYSGMGVVAIKAIQEQQLLITAMQAEIDQLRSMIISQAKQDKYLTFNQ